MKIPNELLTAVLASVPDVLGDDGDHPGSLGRQVSSARLVVAVVATQTRTLPAQD